MQFFPVILQTVSIFVAAASVVIGVTAWRRSALGNRKLEVAEEAICVFQQLMDAIQEIRSPFSFNGEGRTRVRSDNEPEEVSEIYDRAYVAIERANRHSELFSKAFALKHQVAFYFGEDVAVAFSETLEVRKKIYLSSRALTRHWQDQGRDFRTPEQFDAHLDRMHRHEAVFWEGATDPDPITLDLEAAFVTVEQACKQLLNPKPTIWSQLRASTLWTVAYLGLRKHG